MRQATPVWKVALAVFSLLLTVLIWKRGLEESFSRPSVTPELSLNQHEIALLAAPSIPETLKMVLVGKSPEIALRKVLIDIPSDQLEAREKLMLAALEPSIDSRKEILKVPFKDQSYSSAKEALLEDNNNNRNLFVQNNLFEFKEDPALYKVLCLAVGSNDLNCDPSGISKVMALRLMVSQLLPALATLVGSCLLLRQIWILVRNVNNPWPQVTGLPLSLVDMVILVAFGFVVLGEVFLPAFAAPLSNSLTVGIGNPLRDSLRVFVGYGVMTIPPLVILRLQLNSLKDMVRPEGGWLQWRFVPFLKAFKDAINGWLLVMPLVLLTSWIMNLLFGDQGGSNPLLELVLRSHNPYALLLLLVTTVVFAPLFEELVFRGALLPVLAKKFGISWGVVVSAVVFALAHLSVGELAPLTVLGLGLAILRIRSGRLFPCVLMHALWNGVTFTSLILLGG